MTNGYENVDQAIQEVNLNFAIQIVDGYKDGERKMPTLTLLTFRNLFLTVEATMRTNIRRISVIQIKRHEFL